MRPSNIDFAIAGAAFIFALAILRMLSIWIEKTRYWRFGFWLVMVIGAVGVLFWFVPNPLSLRFDDFANAVINIIGWILNII